MLKINTLGGLAITRDGEPVTGLATRKVEALLVYLACTGGSHAREVLAERFWAERAPGRALGNLRVALTSLRKEVGDYLLISRDAVSMQPGASVWLDAAQLEEQLRAGQLEEAVGLYRGEFLSGFYVRGCPGFEDWLTLERERLRRLALDALRDLVDHHLEVGDYRAGIAQAARLLELDPLLEEAHQQLMRLLAYDGQRGAALSQYEACRRVLQDELGVEPDEETARLYRQIHDGELEVPALPSVREPEAVATAPAFLAEAGEVAPRPVFVVRERELARLDGFLQRALAGQGCVVFVTGGPGRGKTALLDAFARQAMEAHADLLVASGTCDAYSGLGDPYLPFREVLGMLTGEVEARWAAGTISRDHALRLWQALPAAVEALLAHGSHVVPALIPGEALLARASAAGPAEPWLARLRERVERRPAAAEGLEQSHLFQQVSYVLHALSQVHPLLLILDDLQWVDRASAGLLFHLGRRLEGARILIVSAYRPEEVALGLEERPGGERGRHPLEKVLAEFKRLYGDVWLDLAEVEAPEGRRFVDALLETEPNRLGEGFRQTLTERAQDHPLFTVELLRAMQERGDLVQDEAGRWVEGPALDWDLLPARVEGVIGERIERLGEELRQILTVASVEGEDFTAEVVAQVQRLEARALVRRLSGELQREHRLVRAQGLRRLGPRRLALYRFQHHLFQRYLYNHLDQAERAYLHEDVGTVLEALYGEQSDEVAVQLARHFVEAGVTAKAAHYLGRAGALAAERYANVEAEDHFRAALELVEGKAERADLLWELGRVLSLQGRYEEAIGVWQEGIAAYRALDDLDGIARLYARTARVAWYSGDYPRGLALCREGMVAVGEAPESPDQADLLHETARACHFNGLQEEAAPLCRQALEMAERQGAIRVQAEALASMGFLPDVPHEEVVSALTRAVELAESAGLLAQAARAHNNLGAWLIDTQARREHFLQAAELYGQRGEILEEFYGASTAAHFSLVLGDLAAVEEVLPSQRQLLDAADKPGAAALELRELEFMLLLFQGELAQAIEGLQALRSQVRETGELQELAWLNENLARACIWEEVGQEEEIEAMLREALDLGYLGTAVPAKSLQSVQRARQGEPEAARHLLTEAQEQAAEQDRIVYWETHLSWAEANLAMAEGHWSEALAAFEVTVDAQGRTNLRWYRARTLIDWAGAHLARGESGDRERAEELLREAEAEFEAMGAHGYVKRVQAHLQELDPPC